MGARRRPFLPLILATVLVAIPAAATHTPIDSVGSAAFPGGEVWDASMAWGNRDTGNVGLEIHDPDSDLHLPHHEIAAERTLLRFENLNGQRPGCFLWDRYTFRIDSVAPGVLTINGVQEWNLCTNERHGHYEGVYLQVVALDLCEGNCLA